MSPRALDKSVAALREAALDVLWGQWSVLGARVGGRVRPPRAIVDPEALVLISGALRDDAPRLWDLAAGFAAESSSILSVQRTKNMAKAYPAKAQAALGEFAAVAARDGKDARWSKVMAGAKPRRYRAKKVTVPGAGLVQPAALWVRLRLAFGVHARTDLLAFLITSENGVSSAKELAQATGYGTMPIRRACESMGHSRILLTEGARPERYRVRQAAWDDLLELGGHAPRWRHWQPIFAFLAHLFVWHEEVRTRQLTPYLMSGEARRLVRAHRDAVTRNRIDAKDPAGSPGDAFLDEVAALLDDVRAWLEKD